MTRSTAYNDCLKSMFSLRRFGIKLELAVIKNILKGLGNPQRNFSCIHIAGTNGKGSIASGIASVLETAGYRTGLYTSPHLVTFNERISVNRKYISDIRVIEAYQAVKRVYGGRREPTFFEFTTAMALYEFSRQNVDWAVIETGMGGRLDATNVLTPAVSIISNISREHQLYLGTTIRQIAGEKGGIIKRHIPVITGVKQKQALSVLNDIAADKSAPLFRLGKDFRVYRTPKDGFTYLGIQNRWRHMTTPLLGRHQVDNAALTLAACEMLQRSGVSISGKNCREGLAAVRWPGRLEIVSESPRIILDGAHNLIAARQLAAFLAQETGGRPLTMIIGILDDKPYQAMLASLVPLASRIIFTRPKIERGLPPEKLKAEAVRYGKDIVLTPDVDTAIRLALQQAKANDIICIAGSLYVVGEAKEALSKISRR